MSDQYFMDDKPDMSAMEELLQGDSEGQVKSVKRGDVVEGVVAHVDAEEVLVDIGLKSEGVLSTKELSAAGYASPEELNIGDMVLVYVVQPDSAEGHPIVSIKKARQEKQWRAAAEQADRGEIIEAEVIDHNKGGLIVNLEGIRGFVPISQILNLRRDETVDSAETQNKLQAMVGRKLQLKIIEINRNRNRLILSERLAVQEYRARRREELLNELQVNEVRKGVVSNIANFGAFVDIGGTDGLVHISQLAWSRVNHPSEVLKVGQEVEVQVLSIDREKKKIALSIKRAEVDPWTTVAQRYSIGQVVQGTITKIATFGAFARIEDGVEGLIHVSEMPAGTTDPKTVLQEGEEVTVRILRIDPERRRLGLSLKQMEEPGATETHPEADHVAAEAEAGHDGHDEAAAATEPVARPRTQPQPQRQEEQPATAMMDAFRAAGYTSEPAEAPKTETPKAEAPKVEAPKAEAAPVPEATEAEAEVAPAAEVLAEVPAGNGTANGASEAPAAEAEAPVSAEPAPASEE